MKNVEEVILEAHVRGILVRQQGRPIAEFPLSVFRVMGAVIPPVLVAIGAIAALVTYVKIEVERVERG